MSFQTTTKEVGLVGDPSGDRVHIQGYLDDPNLISSLKKQGFYGEEAVEQAFTEMVAMFLDSDTKRGIEILEENNFDVYKAIEKFKEPRKYSDEEEKAYGVMIMGRRVEKVDDLLELIPDREAGFYAAMLLNGLERIPFEAVGELQERLKGQRVAYESTLEFEKGATYTKEREYRKTIEAKDMKINKMTFNLKRAGELLDKSLKCENGKKGCPEPINGSLKKLCTVCRIREYLVEGLIPPILPDKLRGIETSNSVW